MSFSSVLELRNLTRVLVALVLLCGASAAEAATRCVDVNATGTLTDGSSWENACRDIQSAVDAASPGDEVWVADGIYTGTGKNVVEMREGVHLYGGFTGDETSRETRDWGSNKTIIDGGDYALSETEYTPNVRRCVYSNGLTSATLDGFVVRNGYARDDGGGMYNYRSSPTVANCTFTGNSADSGGGIFNNGSDPTIADCTFTSNSATEGDGGGMLNFSSWPTVANCTFTGNSARGGNRKPDYRSSGGGMSNFNSRPMVENCTFTGNSAESDGGGMSNYDGSSPTVANCTFTGNLAICGGGMSNDESSPMVKNCTFTSNSVTDTPGSSSYGGGMYNVDSSPTVENCTFAGNYSTDNSGGGMHNHSSSPTVVNCTFTGNLADDNCGGMSNYNSSSPTVKNCVFWENLGGEILNLWNSHPTIINSCIRGGYAGEGNIDERPFFTDPENGDFSLRSGSPCVDAGTTASAPATDILGRPRPQGGGVDMGAYELEDSDGDRIDDAWEMAKFGNLTSATATSDFDGDGLLDRDEHKHGSDYRNPNTDGDGMTDGEDVAQGWDPTLKHGIYRVDAANTTGTEDGASWVTAFRSIQAAVDAPIEGELWIAAGVYTSTSTQVVEMRSGLHLFGGFAGGETSREARDFENYQTVIYGGRARRCVRTRPFTKNATLDGFVVKNGSAAGGGGGMYTVHSSPTVANCIFIGNSTGWYGGGMFNWHSSPTVANCSFTKNSADVYEGGGMYNSGSSPTVANCAFSGNSADWGGGGMNNYFSSPTVANCTFSGSSAECYGGGMYNVHSSPTVENCTFIKNTAGRNGGGIFNYYHSSPTVANCTFSGNSAEWGGGGGMYDYDNSCLPMVVNCIFWENSISEIRNDSSSSSPAVTYSCVRGGYAGKGNIDVDPMFVDPEGGDFQLLAGSLCIDSGTSAGAPATDILGVPRPVGAGFDMGAYEWRVLPRCAADPDSWVQY